MDGNQRPRSKLRGIKLAAQLKLRGIKGNNVSMERSSIALAAFAKLTCKHVTLAHCSRE